MIIVTRKGSNISITGHANFSLYGKDIVCSSVSSIVITTVNGIIELDKNAIKVNDQDGIQIEVLKMDTTTIKLINNMMNLLKELEKKYPKNIKIKEGV